MGQQDWLQGVHSLLFGNLNQARLCTEFLARWGYCFCSVDGESQRLCSWFKYHCKQGYWVGYTGS